MRYKKGDEVITNNNGLKWTIFSVKDDCYIASYENFWADSLKEEHIDHRATAALNKPTDTCSLKYNLGDDVILINGVKAKITGYNSGEKKYHVKTEKGLTHYGVKEYEIWGYTEKEEQQPTDKLKMEAVEHPNHYGGGDNTYEAIKVIEAHGLDFLEGNVLKYLLRYKKKNGLEDLKKAQWYLNRLVAKHDKTA